MKRTTLLTSLLCFLHFAIAQDDSEIQKVIQSQILDQNGNGIPFAAIGIVEKNFGAVTFEDGSFSLNVNEDYMSDSLVVFAIGYERKKIAYDKFVTEEPKSIKVTQVAQELEEVVISPAGFEVTRVGERKKKTSSTLSFITPQKGTTATVLFNEKGFLMQIKEIAISVAKRNIDSFQLRCMLFKVGADSMPGEQILKENLISTFTDDKGILKFKLDKDLWLEEPFFLGFEWIMTKAQFEAVQKGKEVHPLKFLNFYSKQYPQWKYSISDNSRIVFRDNEGASKKVIELNKAQIAQLSERNEEIPKVLFQIHYKDGLKTLSGSYITEKWRKHPYHLLVSVMAGMDKEEADLMD